MALLICCANSCWGQSWLWKNVDKLWMRQGPGGLSGEGCPPLTRLPVRISKSRWELISSWVSLPNNPFWGMSLQQTPVGSHSPLEEVSVTMAVKNPPPRLKSFSLSPENDILLCSPQRLQQTKHDLPFSVYSVMCTAPVRCRPPGRRTLLGFLRKSFATLFSTCL